LLPAIDPDYPDIIGQLFILLAIVVTHRLIDDPASHQVDPVHVGMFSQGAGQLHHVFGLSAGIGIAAEFQIVATNQPMDTEQDKVDFFIAGLHIFGNFG
jgi:hypothetical protein